MASDSNSLHTEQTASEGGLSTESSRLRPPAPPRRTYGPVPQALDAACLPPSAPSRRRPLGTQPPALHPCGPPRGAHAGTASASRQARTQRLALEEAGGCSQPSSGLEGKTGAQGRPGHCSLAALDGTPRGTELKGRRRYREHSGGWAGG